MDTGSRFPATTWPNEPLPAPGSRRRVTVTLTGTALCERRRPSPPLQLEHHRQLESGEITPGEYGSRTSPLVRQSIARELYLELEDVNLDDPTAIAAFATEAGILGISWNNYRLLAGVPGFHSEHRAILEESFAVSVGTEPESRWVEHGVPHPAQMLSWSNESIDEFRFGAGVLRDLRGLWLTSLGGNAESDVTWSVLKAPSSPTAAALSFARILSPALEPFHPRIVTPGHTPEPPLFAVLALQLFNHVAENAEYRRCANEKCGRTFVRQTGGAHHGQHRTRGSLKYCTDACYSAQKARRYRDRKRHQK